MNKKIPTTLGITMVALLVAIVAGVAVWQYYSLSREQVEIERETETVEILKPIEDEITKKTYEEVYYINIAIKEEVSLVPTEKESYPKFKLLAENYIGFYPPLSEEIISKKIVYDKRDILHIPLPFVDEKGRDFSYYVLIESYQPIEMEERYEDEDAVITVEKGDVALISYIKDRNYCQVNEDCNIGYNLCAYGAFNQFEEWVYPYGCEYRIYPEENINELYEICDRDKEIPNVKYSRAECINNKCAGKERIVTCEEGNLP